jgi:hypothetical protein
MWHGRRIRATNGDPAELLGVIGSIPGSLDYFLRELEKEKLPREGRPLPCRSWCWRWWWPPSPEAPSAGQAVSGAG